MPGESAIPPESAARAQWHVAQSTDASATHALAVELNVPEWFAVLLVQRGVSNKLEAEAYLDPSLNHLHDPSTMLGMSAAVERILVAIQQREPVLIYGDYDVDGTLATVLLKSAIDRLAPEGEPSLVRYHIPHRMREGYGMQGTVLHNAAADGVRLVISVDTGIRAFAAAQEAEAAGLDLIVTDHHLPDSEELPRALAVINPNQPGCPYPFKDLCGAAVAFKLAYALLRAATDAATAATHGCRCVDPKALERRIVPSFLKLVAIATVADAVPLRDENRVLASLGLRELRDPRSHGLRALMDVSGALPQDGGEPTAMEIGFRIAPRINAAGRMDVASDVVRLLLTQDAVEARAIAEKLHQLNADRREVEAKVLDEIERQITAEVDAPRCLVLDGDGWHRGVVGILASRVVERTNRPAVVIGHENGEAHGSGRSIRDYHLLDAITAVNAESPLFTRFGGHAFAVGFSMPSDRVPELRERLARHAAAVLRPEHLQPRIEITAHLPLEAITPAVPNMLRRLEPFGHGNHEPVFLARGVVIAEEPRALKEKHLRLRLAGANGQSLGALCWSRGIAWPERMRDMKLGRGSRVDVVYRLRENRHPQWGGIEAEVCDLRPAERPAQQVTGPMPDFLQPAR